MVETGIRMGVNWRQAGGEALLIFLGVAVAIAGQAWWEYRNDRELERHLIQGIRSDLAMDSSDLASAMQVARGRVAGADFLMAQLGDPDAGQYHPREWTAGRPGARKTEAEWLQESLAEYEGADLTAREALYMVTSTVSLQVLDVFDATFREATEGGRLNVIQDVELRSRIAEYYFNTSRFGSTGDERVEVHFAEFRRALASVGLSMIGGASSEQVLAAFQNNPTALAELKNARDYAVFQMAQHDVTLQSAQAVIGMLDRAQY